jgi:hypothetical protein
LYSDRYRAQIKLGHWGSKQASIGAGDSGAGVGDGQYKEARQARALAGLIGTINSSLRNHTGKDVQQVNEAARQDGD